MSVLGYMFGDILYTERIFKGFSQDKLCDEIANLTNDRPKRQTISSWEKGLTCPDLKQLQALSEIFNCDIAFLLGETKTRRAENEKYINNLGLSENAIEILRKKASSITKEHNKDYLMILSALIENKTFLDFMISCINADYGEEDFTAIARNPYTGKENAFDICIKMLLASDNMKLFEELCNFVNKQRNSKSLHT